jgi:LysM repeat protein
MKTATTPLKNIRTKAFALAVLATASLTTVGLGAIAIAQETETRAGSGTGIPLAADAPDRYTVKQGDTLWDISKVFLRDPWYWPEIWYVNPQVKNPHLIYPGDVLVLVKGGAGGQPQVTIAERGPEGAAAETRTEQPTSGGIPTTKLSPQIRSTPISSAVTAISYDTIAAFLGRPTLLSKDEVKSGPYVVALRDDHIIGGAGNDVYARGVKEIPESTRYNFMHVDLELRDPETNKVLGYRGIYAGTGAVTATGDPAKLQVQEVQREVLRGDKLFPEHVAVELDFLPRAPSGDVKGSVVAVAGVTVAGAHEVIAINRGGKHGLEAGHVLAILQKGEKIRDHYEGGSSAGDGYKGSGRSVVLPDERIGLLMVFKTYENMSYALIMEATHPVRAGDIIHTP